MKQIKSFLVKYPESILICSVLFYWLSTTPFNPFAIGLLVALLLLLKLKSKKIGIAIGLLFLLASCYMTLALLSELSEFNTFTHDAWQLFIIGTFWLLGSLTFSILMLYKYMILNK